MKDSEKWTRLGDQLSESATYYDMIGRYETADRFNKGATEAYAHAREARESERQVPSGN